MPLIIYKIKTMNRMQRRMDSFMTRWMANGRCCTGPPPPRYDFFFQISITAAPKRLQWRYGAPASSLKIFIKERRMSVLHTYSSLLKHVHKTSSLLLKTRHQTFKLLLTSQQRKIVIAPDLIKIIIPSLKTASEGD